MCLMPYLLTKFTYNCKIWQYYMLAHKVYTNNCKNRNNSGYLSNHSYISSSKKTWHLPYHCYFTVKTKMSMRHPWGVSIPVYE